MGSAYLGTIAKGNEEGIRIMPAEMNRELFERLLSPGKGMAGTGELDLDLVREIAKPERFPRVLSPLFRAFLKTRFSHSYFDRMLIENKAYERKNEPPFLEKD